MTWSVVVVLTALAGEPAENALTLFNAGNFEGALTQVELGLKAHPTPAARAQEELLRARCFTALHRPLDVEGALENALLADPVLTLEGLDVSPAFVATFERARARLAGTVTVDTEPPGAGIRIDGVLVGASPVKQLLPVGAHRLEVLDAAGVPGPARTIVVAPKQSQMLVLPGVVTITAPATPVVEAPAVEQPWVAVPAVAGRASYDLANGASFEVGVALLGRYWVAELDALIGAFGGAGVRLGGRLPLWRDLLGLQLTLDGQLTFATRVVPGIGGTLSVLVHPVSWLDLLVEGGARFVQAEPGYRPRYGLLSLGARVRWPFAVGP